MEYLIKKKLMQLIDPRPPPYPLPYRYNQAEHYEYHQTLGHTLNRCFWLKHDIQDLINEGKVSFDPKPTNPSQKFKHHPKLTPQPPTTKACQHDRSHQQSAQTLQLHHHDLKAQEGNHLTKHQSSVHHKQTFPRDYLPSGIWAFAHTYVGGSPM